MQYRWDDYCLDRPGGQLTRREEHIQLSRKAIECITYLIEQRHRAVSYDELIREVWGHKSVTNQQLAQLVLTVRRALGDNGHTQRSIRTLPGLGYRWVGALREITDGDATPQSQVPDAPSPAQVAAVAPAPETSPPPPPQAGADEHATAPASQPRAATIAWYRSGLRAVAGLTLILTVIASAGWQLLKTEPAATAVQPAAAIAADPLARLEAALWKGQYEEVREGLASLPSDLADSPDAHVLEISLDMHRGRNDRALEKLALQQTRAKAAADPVWQAKLLATQSVLNANMGKYVEEVLAPAQSAVMLLESEGNEVPPHVMGLPLLRRGQAFLRARQFERAQEDLVRARDLLLQAGDRRAILAKGALARVWMLTGRMADALDEMTKIANTAEQSGDFISEITSRDAAISINIELLRWRDALANSQRSTRLLLQSAPDSVHRARILELHALALTANGQLREAGSVLEEAEAFLVTGKSMTISAMFNLASGHPQQALADATKAFSEDNPIDHKTSILLENKEGALLLWMTAAQDLVAAGNAMPVPSPAQRKVLQQPESSIGHTAHGRWLWSQGQLEDAQAEFQRALEQAQLTHRPLHMLLASEPLIELLLQRGDTQTAMQVMAKLRAHDPDLLDQCYRANVLGLRIALAAGDATGVKAAYRKTQALAGERKLPTDVATAYAQRTPRVVDPHFNDMARLSP
jgi:DNA-binding winged helix-turn-helix (wHTH) protein/tetratricopeptide (TPR) repeat protein